MRNLPDPLTSFIGRERELGEFREALAVTRLLTLTGPRRMREDAFGDQFRGAPGGRADEPVLRVVDFRAATTLGGRELVALGYS